MIILLDANIIIQDPSILAKKKEGITLATTESIISELSIIDYHPKSESVYKLIKTAINSGNIKVYPSDKYSQKQFYGYRISGADADLISTAIALKVSGADAAIATGDKYIIQIAEHNGIRTLSLNELKEIFQEKGVIVDAKLMQRADRWSSTRLRNLLISVIIPIVMSIVGNIIWNKSDIIISSFPIWGTIIAIFIFGVGAYAIRGRYRLSYGILEFSFGFTLIVRVFYPSFNYGTLQIVDFLQIVGGLYIMVRGLDNIGVGSKGTKIERFWEKLSGEKRS